MEVQNQNQFTDPFIQHQPVPNSTAVLVLGIISIPTCFCWGVLGLTCGIIAIVLAVSGMKSYKANPGMYSQASLNNLNAGRICAIIGTVLAGIYVIFIVVYIFILGTAMSSMLPWENLRHLN